MRLSIIIPVYKTENTLNRCLESIISQVGHDIEIILVDDGSPDSSPAICDNWSKKDSNIKVIHKANGGLSDARNWGIDASAGDYLTFIDSDDYIEAGTIEQLLGIISEHPEYDILEYSIKKIRGTQEEPLILNDIEYKCEKEYWCAGKAYTHSYACNKIFKRHLFDDVRFPQGVIFEDIWTLPLLTRNAKTIATTHIGAYCYCINPEGITANADGQALRMLLNAHSQLISNNRLELAVNSEYMMHVANIQMDVMRLTDNKPSITIPRLSIAAIPGCKNKLKAITINICGFNVLYRINRLKHKIFKCLS